MLWAWNLPFSHTKTTNIEYLMRMGECKDLLEQCVSEEEIAEIKQEAQLEAEALRTMQQNIKKREKHEIG